MKTKIRRQKSEGGRLRDGLTLVLIILVGSLVLILRGNPDSYYRGVYEGCVRQSAVVGKVTLFDLIQCREITDHARVEKWFEQALDYELPKGAQ